VARIDSGLAVETQSLVRSLTISRYRLGARNSSAEHAPRSHQGASFNETNTWRRGNFSNKEAGLLKLVARTSVGLPAIHCDRSATHAASGAVVGNAWLKEQHAPETSTLGRNRKRSAGHVFRKRWKQAAGLLEQFVVVSGTTPEREARDATGSGQHHRNQEANGRKTAEAITQTAKSHHSPPGTDPPSMTTTVIN
jgi:hypothetical protein